ncbi:MAG: hypothetical protein AAF840_07380, partial [Bacteroidota bacterium]
MIGLSSFIVLPLRCGVFGDKGGRVPKRYYRLYSFSSFLLSITLLVCLPSFVGGQDIEAIKEARPVTVSGGLRVGTQFYNVSGIPQRAAPFQFTASGRLNVSIL